MIPLTVPETRRVLQAYTRPPEARRHALAWSHWRRRHQAHARDGHTRRRANSQVPPPNVVETIVAVPGTPLLTEALWAAIAPLFPARQGKRGRAPSGPRPMLEGILAMMNTGGGWRAMPRAFGAWHTVYSRYQQWGRNGTWTRILAVLLAEVV
jgi:hypothetical protein